VSSAQLYATRVQLFRAPPGVISSFNKVPTVFARYFNKLSSIIESTTSVYYCLAAHYYSSAGHVRQVSYLLELRPSKRQTAARKLLILKYQRQRNRFHEWRLETQKDLNSSMHW
jgi:hypothetical protein